MKKLNIMIGESSSASPKIIEKYGFISIPFKLIWEGTENIEGDNLFQKMRKAVEEKIQNGPKTSQPSIGIYKKAFEEALKDAEKVLYVCLSSKLSGAYNSAIQAHKMLTPENKEKVYIFDSLNADGSELMLAIKAKEFADEGMDVERIIERLDLLKNDIRLFASLESASWLEAGGRIPHALSVMVDQMQKLGMRPILMIKEGEIRPAMLKMQAKDPATALLKTLDDLSKEALKQGKNCRVIITHGDNINEVEKVREEIERKYPDRIRIEFIGLIGPVIGAHVGPGALICCLTEDE
ncbi:MAG: DegV family protein [Candidatus Pacebacteria bacterium]|nr:DegV family protein [Candidatus Paceibacterota bacterium]